MSALVKNTFHAHQTQIIGPWSRSNPDNLARCYRFVIATIQQPLSLTPQIMADYDKHGSASRFAFGFKSGALDYIAANSEELYHSAIDAWQRGDAKTVLNLFANLPGLGLVKGGFFAQCVFGLVGCLDSHNIRRFDINPARINASRLKNAKRAATRDAILCEYLDLCARCGGAASLWASWCFYVATRDKSYIDAAAVSKMHVTALGIDHA